MADEDVASEAERRPKVFRRRGIAPRLLREQVANTAAWALDERTRGESWQSWLRESTSIDDSWQSAEARAEYLKVMLAAHFTTCSTFVPTDVDTHIRHHIWQEVETVDALSDLVHVVDEASAWNPLPVSARVIEGTVAGDISALSGEWLSVRAGALGRALALGAGDLVEHLSERIEHEVVREAQAIEQARREGHAQRLLSLCAVSAHNCGDLSRVVEAWPRGTPERDAYLARFAKLGQQDASRFGGQHHFAGHVNKEVMASENHRFLALRAPRGLRRDRQLLIPFGPFFDAWGETIGRSPLLDEKDRGEVVAALTHGLDQSVDRWGYHRALAGLHRTSAGGLDRLVSHLPARLRHHIQKGPVRDALRVDAERFMARMDNALKAAIGTYSANRQN